MERKETETLRHRLGWLHRGLGAPWPDMSDAALTASLDDWLLPFLSGAASFARIDPGALHSGLMSLVPHESAAQDRQPGADPLRRAVGKPRADPLRRRNAGAGIRVQELFGLGQHPSIADGTVPLTLELLSPAHRPIQTTRDLPGFWRGSWADVRSDMRGRYPKHVWPDDPLAADGHQPRQAARQIALGVGRLRQAHISVHAGTCACPTSRPATGSG